MHRAILGPLVSLGKALNAVQVQNSANFKCALIRGMEVAIPLPDTLSQTMATEGEEELLRISGGAVYTDLCCRLQRGPVDQMQEGQVLLIPTVLCLFHAPAV